MAYQHTVRVADLDGPASVDLDALLSRVRLLGGRRRLLFRCLVLAVARVRTLGKARLQCYNGYYGHADNQFKKLALHCLFSSPLVPVAGHSARRAWNSAELQLRCKDALFLENRGQKRGWR